MKRFPRTSRSNLRFFTSCLLSFLLLIAPMATLAASFAPRAAIPSTEKASGASPKDAPQPSASTGIFNRFAEATTPVVAAEQNSTATRGLFGSLMPAVPSITATKVDSFVTGGDVDNDGKADPGDTITYTVTISNSVADATGVVFNDTIHPHTSFVSGSLNASPLANNDTYETLGNTLLEVGPVASPSSSVKLTVTGSVLDNDTDFLGDSAPTVVAPFPTSSTNGGIVSMDSAGHFSFTPKEGSTASDTFTYTISDDGADNAPGGGDDLTSTATVTITIKTPRIWYVQNNAAPGGLGRSTDPFDTLLEAQAAATAVGDIVYVFIGDGTNLNQNAGFTFQANSQQLLGEGVALQPTVTVNGDANPLLRNAGARPDIGNAGGTGVTVTDKSGILIRGFDITGNTNAVAATFNVAGGGVTINTNTIAGGTLNAIDVTTGGTGGGSATISSNTISGAGAEGIDINSSGSGTLTLDVQSNTLNATGNAFDVLTNAGTTLLNFSNNTGITGGNAAGSAVNIVRPAGALTITGFANNQVNGTTLGAGITVTGATFDSTPGNPFNTVSGGTTLIGASGVGNGAGTSGMVLTSVIGDLSFTDLDVYADNGAAVQATGVGAFNASAGTGFQLVVNSSVATWEATNGPAANISTATVNLQLASLKSTNSNTNGSNGVSLNTVAGTFSAPAGSTITDAVNADFNITAGSANVTYGGTITDDLGQLVSISNETGGTKDFNGLITDGNDGDGQGISLQSNSSTTIRFDGGLTLSTGGNNAFVATFGGTLAITDPAGTDNTITTTTGTPLNVTSTDIHADDLTFRSITAGTAASGPPNGIVLNTTGSNGSLIVTGDGNTSVGGNASGGTIQRTTLSAISLTSTTSPSFTNVTILNSARNGVDGTGVVNFTFQNGTINTVGTGNAGQYEENAFTFADKVAPFDSNTVSGTVNITQNTITQPRRNGIKINTWNGTISNITVTDNTISGGTTTANILSAIEVLAQGSASTTSHITTGTFQNNTISGFRFFDVPNNFYIGGRGIEVGGGNTGNTTPVTIGAVGTPIIINNNKISNVGDNFIKYTFNGRAGFGNVNITNNGTLVQPMLNAEGVGLSVYFGGNMTGNAVIDNNFLDINNRAASSGIAVQGDNGGSQSDTTNANFTITNNRVDHVSGNGIIGIGINNEGNLNIQIKNNSIPTAPAANNFYGIRVSQNGNAVGNQNPTVCADIEGNTTVGSGFATGIGLRKESTFNTAPFGVEGMAATASPGVELYVDGLNTSQPGPPFGDGNGVTLISATTGFSNCSSAPGAMYKPETNQQRDYLAQTDNIFLNSEVASPLAILNIDQEFASTLLSATQTKSVETQANTAKSSQAIAGGNHLDAMLALMKQGSQATSPTVNEAASESAPIRDTSVALSHASSRPVTGDLSTGKDSSATQPNRAAKTAAASPAASTLMPSGGAIPTVNIGALKAGQSVTIKFQVTLDDPPNLDAADLVGGPHVRNQGTVTADGGISVMTDDTAVGGLTDPTDTLVDLYDSQTTVITSNNNSSQGEPITFTATVAQNQVGSPGTPTGTVTFFDGANPITCAEGPGAQTLSSGVATCTTSGLTPGAAKTIKAQYNGDGNFDTSFGTVSQTVIACSNNPIVTSTADSGPNTLRDAVTTICTAPNNNVTFNLGAGAHTITLLSELPIAKSITITNTVSGTNGPVTISGGGTVRVFNIASTASTVGLTNLTISNGSALTGGAILNDSSILTIYNSTISGNTASTDGGGIANIGTGTLTITNSTISGNRASENGGGIHSLGTATLKNVTVTNNHSDNDDNASGAGGGINVAGGTFIIHNTIVAGNFKGSATTTADDVNNNLDSSSSFNIIGVGGGLTNGSGGNQTGVSLSSLRLGVLASNGGATQTHALLAGSPALDAGDNSLVTAPPFSGPPFTDQRGTGYLRIRDAADADTTQTVDIGAFEADPSVEDIGDKSTTEDTALPTFIFNVGDSATAFDSITATSSNTTLVPNANITVGADTPSTRSLSITPAANQSGTTTITVTVTKTISGTPVSMTDTFVLTVSEINDTPIAGNDPLSSVAEDSGQRFILYSTLLSNDSPPTGDAGQTITIISVGSEVGGTAVLDNANSRVVFTPTADYNGPASFQYTIEDNGTTNGSADPKTATATVSFTITEVNDTPVPANETLATVPENSPQISIPFSAVTTNDSRGAANESGQTLVVQAISNTVGGTFILDSMNSQILFTPTANYTGPASFDYTVRDNGTTNGVAAPLTSAVTAKASFSVGEVNDPPTAVDDTLPDVAEDSGQRIIAYSNIVGNDSKGPVNENGQTLVVKTVSNPVGGTVVNDSANSRVLFTLTPDFNGTASFQYNVEDNGTSGGNPDPQTSANVATVSFTVTEINDAPVVVADTLTDVAEDSGQRIIPFSDLTTNDNRGAANESAQTLSVTSVSNAVGGAVTLDIPNSRVLFTPNADFHGTASFNYTVIDNGTTNGSSDPKSSAAAGTASFTVTPVADTPTVTDATTTINTQTTSGLVLDRNAIDSVEVTHFKITGITNGTLYQNDGVTQINDGDFITYAEGNAGLKFTPALNKNTPGGDTFSFQVQGATDGTGGGLSSNFATATITVDCQTGLVVTSTADDGSAGTLRHAIDIACPGSTITFNLAPGLHTITLSTGELFINKNLTINGPSGAGNRVTISANSSRVLKIGDNMTVNISNLTVSNGQASDGGGIHNDGGLLTLTNITVSGNSATGSGGGILNNNGGSLTVTNSTISGNSATGSGGGIANEDSLTVTNSTISGNSAGNLGGGIFSSGLLNVTNSTITNNRADSDNNGTGTGGGIHNDGGTATLHNTIVAGNFNEGGVSDPADDLSGTFQAGSSFNLIGDAATSGGLQDKTVDAVNGNIVGNAGTGTIDARLGALANNGGSTETHALLTSSPALDAGSNAKSDAAGLTTDQRGTGFPRKADGPDDPDTTDTVDIGAFEAQASVQNIGDQTINEDNPLNLVFNVGDADAITNVTASSGNTTLVPNDALHITVNAGPTASQRTLVINPATNENGTATITVTVTSGTESVSDTFVLTVTAVNDAPTFTKGPDQLAVNSNPQTATNWATNISAGPPDESGQSVNFQIVSNTNPALFTTQPAIDSSGTLTYTPVFGASGTTTVTIELKDNGGILLGGQDTSAQQSFMITVSPIGWSTSGDSGVTEDESNPARATYANFTAAFNSGSPAGTYVLRYNIIASGNLTSGSVNTRFRVRFRDDGAGSRVKVAIMRSPLGGGTFTQGIVFDSDNYAPNALFQTQEILMPSLVFDFTQNVYWLEVTLTKADTADQPGFGSVQINQQ